MQRIVSLLLGARAKVSAAVLLCAAMVTMAFASVAGAAEPILTPAVKKTEETFTENLPVLVTLIGLLVAVTLVIVYFRKHAKKG